MEKIEKLLKQFGTLQEFTDFLGELVEAEGSEISRGKDPQDKSKMEKQREQEADEEPAEEVPVGDEGGEMMGAEEPVIDPVQAPGSQVAIGNKDTNDADDPKTTKVKISGKKEKIDLKPKIEVDSSSLK